jgi:hypothetical protein
MIFFGNACYHSVENILCFRILNFVWVWNLVSNPGVRTSNEGVWEQVRKWWEELHKFYNPPYIIRVIRWRRMRWASMQHAWDRWKMHTKFWSVNLKRQATWGTTHKWEDNIRMDVKETVWRFVDWIHLAEDRNQWRAPGNAVMKLRILWETKFLD